MILMKNKILFLLPLCLLAGCALADLRPETLRDIEIPAAPKVHGREILAQVAQQQGIAQHWGKYKIWKIVAMDIWKDQWMRLLTPIKQSEQRLDFVIDLPSRSVLMTFLEGKFKDNSLGWDRDGTFGVINNEMTRKEYRDVDIYVVPVRDYFLWPQTLLFYPVQVFAGETTLKAIPYDKIFVTRGSVVPNDKDDQYIVWVNRQTHKIDYVEYTLRNLFGFYRGVVAYRDYRPVQGMDLSFEIQLLNKIDSEKYSHKLLIDMMSFQ
jgi:hypothetical protein